MINCRSMRFFMLCRRACECTQDSTSAHTHAPTPASCPSEGNYGLHSPAFLTYSSKPPRSLMTGTPVAKAPRTADSNLFRTIIPTSVVCKVLEAILKGKMLARLFQFSLLTSRQHGFLPRRSTLTKPPRGRRIDYKMARRRECSRPDLSRLL